MTLRLKLAVAIYVAIGLLPLLSGVTYLAKSEFMPFHAEAAALEWSQLSPGTQAVVLTLMKATGGAYVAFALSYFVILLLPFRQGIAWAKYALPALGLLLVASSLNALSYLAGHSQATVPWVGPAAGGILCVVAFVLSVATKGSDGNVA